MTIEQVQEQIPGEDTLHCANHPNRETLLRCNRCSKPICLDCAVLTDVGYRCKECIRGVQDNYFNAGNRDYVIAFFIALIVTAIATPLLGFFLGMFGFFFGFIIAFLIGSGAGTLLAQIIRKAINRRRGRYLPLVTTIGIVIGIFMAIFLTGGSLLNLPMLLFAFLAISTMYPFLR